MNFNEEHVSPISLLVQIQNDDIISRKILDVAENALLNYFILKYRCLYCRLAGKIDLLYYSSHSTQIIRSLLKIRTYDY